MPFLIMWNVVSFPKIYFTYSMNQIKKMSGLPPVSPKSSVRFFLKFALNTYLRNKSTLFKLLYKVNLTFPQKSEFYISSKYFHKNVIRDISNEKKMWHLHWNRSIHVTSPLKSKHIHNYVHITSPEGLY